MLLGRERELAQLGALLDDARRGTSACLVVRGEPGVGKSALLRHTMDRARDGGFAVLQARGIESESELSFAGLADLIRPIRETLAAIPPAQAAALAGAIALGPPQPGDRFAACAATLSVVAAAAERAPVLVVVDDIQWLDESSVEAVLFVARRLGTEGVALLIALREGERTEIDLAGLPSMHLGGIDADSAVRLLTSARPSVAPAVAIRLHEMVNGNPLALMEIPALLSDAERGGGEPLPDPLPTGPHLERAFLRRSRSLPRESQDALLVAAASDTGDLATIQRALEHLGVRTSAVEAAESSGLITIDGVQLRFRHPLVRSAIYQSAGVVARRAAHRALAAALDAEQVADRRAWHLAAATTSPDESVARALEDVATRSRARTGFAAASRALVRAAGLSPATSDRARRLLAAATTAQLAGRPDDALRLLDDSSSCEPSEELRAEIARQRASIEMWAGSPIGAHERMLAEARRVRDRDPIRASVFFAEAAVPCFMAGQVRLALETAELARECADRVAGPTRPLIVDAILAEALMLSGASDEASRLTEECVRRASRQPAEAAREAQYVPFSLLGLERYDEARAMLMPAIDLARGASAVGLLPYGLASVSELELRTGDLAAAYAAGAEAVQLAADTNQRSTAAYCYATLARVEAAQGRDADCRAHVAIAVEGARTYGVHSIFNYATAVLGLLELGRGRAERATVHLDEAAQMARLHGLREPNVVQWQPDYIESLARAGRTDDALRSLAELERDAERTGRAWARATAARCRGYLADGAFEEHFTRALELHRASPSPFEVARTRLCYGERLRRARRRVEARAQLHEALATFERLGAEPWADRASAELAATGERARRRNVSATRELTPQELQIALTVAQGATNREAAARLFLSEKTVEAHLTSSYRKLGVRSRTELVAMLARAHDGAWERPQPLRIAGDRSA